jgi:hypothetical protein
MKGSRRRISTACSAFVRFIRWENGAAGTGGIPIRERRAAENAYFPTNEKTMIR